jgi:TonB family protein
MTVSLVVAQQRDPARGLPWGAPPGPADPLEPWSLGAPTVHPGLLAGGAAAKIALATPAAPPQVRDPRLDPAPDFLSFPGADSTAADATAVVVLQQILIDNPHHARQLRTLFDAGVTWDSARSLLKLGEVKEYRREYAVDDLAGDMAIEIAALPDSSWSSGHPWRGRTMFYRVLGRASRSRASLPALGQGLDANERARLAELRPKLREPVIQGTDNRQIDAEDFVEAVLAKQEPATFPEQATTDGEVTLVVHLGRLGDVSKVEVEDSTDAIFEQAAIDAARRSEYRSATRNGVPEPSTLRITYPFRVPAPVPIDQP